MPRRKKDGSPPVTWDDRYYVLVYRLVQAGLTRYEIAGYLGATDTILNGWEKRRPALKEALQGVKRGGGAGTAGGHYGNGVGGGTAGRHVPDLLTYVYRRLPEHLQHLWDRVEEVGEAPNASHQIDLLFKDGGERARQYLYLHALVKYNFNPSDALRAVNLTKKELDRWCEQDPDFPELLAQIKWHMKNFVERCLMDLVAAHDTAAVVLANKTLNRDRGYGEKVELEVKGKVEHTVSVDELPLEVKREMLAAIRAKKEQKQLPLTIDAANGHQGTPG